MIIPRSYLRELLIEYIGSYGYCSKCGKNYAPPTIVKSHGNYATYGFGFRAWFVYQRIAMRMPYESIIELAQEQFNETVSQSSIPNFIRDLALRYSKTEKISVQHLLNSPFIHVDETPVNIRGEIQYTWVFTNGVHTILRLTQTRESTIVHEMLAGYEGVLISDFYPGYDSVNCKQQKCWVHLIRDLNNDLRQSPFDIEYEVFISEVRNLIVPIMETIQIYGLRKRNLNKFVRQVDNFYDRTITKKKYKSELDFGSDIRMRFVR